MTINQNLSPKTTNSAKALIDMHSQAGCDVFIQNKPRNFYQPSKPQTKPQPQPDPHSQAKPQQQPSQPQQPSQQDDTVLGAIAATKLATEIAANAKDLDSLKTAVESFEGCDSLKKTATQLVFADGVPSAEIILIGEAPGSQEDKQGKPFVGESGQLLDLMLSYIGLNRDRNFYITNTVFWRPAGNRPPTEAEINICAPFVHRHIELIKPKLILLLGNFAVKHFFQTTTGITRMRGQWQDYNLNGEAIPMLATFHPAYLLRKPAEKKLVWQDLRSLKSKITELNIALNIELAE